MLLTACGGGNDNKETQFYKKQETVIESKQNIYKLYN